MSGAGAGGAEGALWGPGPGRLDAQSARCAGTRRRGPGPGAGAGEEWIVDTGPVIVLAKIGRLDLLTRLARAVLLPSPVVQEIRRGPAVGPARRAVEAGRGTEVPVRYIRVAVRSLGLLGPGEQSVLNSG